MNMINKIIIFSIALIFALTFVIVILKRETLVILYNSCIKIIPKYAKIILYVVVLVLLIFLIVFELFQYKNINLLKYIIK